MTPEDWTQTRSANKGSSMLMSRDLQASELETLAGLKPAVAVGGIDCETVVLAFCAAATARRADAMESADSILVIVAGKLGSLRATGLLMGMMEELEHGADVNAGLECLG